MNLPNSFETIQRYLTRQMTESEQATFDEQLQNSPQLAEEVQTLKDWRFVAQHQDLFATKQMLQTLIAEKKATEKDLPPKSPTQGTIGGITKVVILVSVLSLVGVAYWRWDAYPREADNRHYKALVINILSKYNAPNVLGLDTTRTQFTGNSLVTAMKRYDAEKFEEVISILERGFEFDNEAQFYWAMSVLKAQKSEKYERMILILKNLAQNSQTAMYEMARQYLPIALVANGEIAAAKAFLNELEATEKQKQPVKMLLEKLE